MIPTTSGAGNARSCKLLIQIENDGANRADSSRSGESPYQTYTQDLPWRRKATDRKTCCVCGRNNADIGLSLTPNGKL